MIDLDYGPVCFMAVVAIGFFAPFIYSLFVDNYDKINPQIKYKNS
jgi:hypothetical protein